MLISGFFAGDLAKSPISFSLLPTVLLEIGVCLAELISLVICAAVLNRSLRAIHLIILSSLGDVFLGLPITSCFINFPVRLYNFEILPIVLFDIFRLLDIALIVFPCSNRDIISFLLLESKFLITDFAIVID